MLPCAFRVDITKESKPVSNLAYPRLFLLIVSAMVLGGLLEWRFLRLATQAAPVETPSVALVKPAELTMTPAAVEAELARLKGVAPSASVAMAARTPLGARRRYRSAPDGNPASGRTY